MSNLVRVPRSLLPDPLEAHEVEAVLAQPEVTEVQGLRDRALLELLYSTGLRRAEAMRLTVYDIEPLRGIVRVPSGQGRQGPGGADR